MTALDLFTASLRVIGSLGSGEVPSADDASITMQAFNLMLDQMSADRKNLFSDSIQTLALTATKQAYQIGPSAADFPGTRPVLIKNANVIIPGTTGRLEMSLISNEAFMALTERGLSGVFPDKLWNDYGSPISTLNVHPIPNQAISIEIAAWVQLTQVVSLTDILNFPPGYLDELKYNLALKIAPEFGMVVDQISMGQALAGKATIQQINQQLMQTFPSANALMVAPTAGNPAPSQPVQAS